MRARWAAAVFLVLGSSLARADVDWRTKGAVTPVKNQGDICDSWAFAITGIVEGAFKLQGMSLLSLSEQQLLDCASPDCVGADDPCACGNIGCFMDWVRTNGECKESDYPYTARIGTCKTTCMPAVPSGFAGNWQRLSGEASLTAGIDQAPILARLEVGDNGQLLDSFATYASDIFDPASWDASVVQWVLLVGYTADYYIVKNSFGVGWGMGGYMWLKRGTNRLGVGNFAYALLSGTASTGACTLAGGSCLEVTAEACTDASGSFAGVGTFCETACSSWTTTPTPTATPTETPTSTITATPTLTPVPQGGACASGSQCATTYCVDAVCCDTACTGPLEQCNLAGHAGTCASAAAPAPALASHALLAAVTLLAAIAAWALRRRLG